MLDIGTPIRVIYCSRNDRPILGRVISTIACTSLKEPAVESELDRDINGSE